MDIELSTKSDAHDVINVTFIFSGRWVGAGWVVPLTDFINDPKKTPADWDASDFLPALDCCIQGPAGPVVRDSVDRRRAHGGRLALRPDPAGRPEDARHVRSDWRQC